MRRIVVADSPLKERRLVELELTLVRDELVNKRRSWHSPSRMQGAAAALEWVLCAQPSAAPLSGEYRDSSVRADLRAERTYAEDVMHWPARHPELNDLATRPGMQLADFASGINEELEWVLGSSSQTALSVRDEELEEEVADLT